MLVSFATVRTDFVNLASNVFRMAFAGGFSPALHTFADPTSVMFALYCSVTVAVGFGMASCSPSFTSPTDSDSSSVADSSLSATLFPYAATSSGSAETALFGLFKGNVFRLGAHTSSVITTLHCSVPVASSNSLARTSPSLAPPTDSDSSSVADSHISPAFRFPHLATSSGSLPFACYESSTNFHSLGMLSFAVLRRVFGCAPVAASFGGESQSVSVVFAGTFLGDTCDVTVSEWFAFFARIACSCDSFDGISDDLNIKVTIPYFPPARFPPRDSDTAEFLFGFQVTFGTTVSLVNLHRVSSFAMSHINGMDGGSGFPSC